MKKNGKEHLKKTGDELQEYLLFRRRGSAVKAKKARGLNTSVSPNTRGMKLPNDPCNKIKLNGSEESGPFVAGATNGVFENRYPQ